MTDNRIQMATSRTPSLFVKTGSEAEACLTSEPPMIGNCDFQVLLRCDANGEVVNLEPVHAENDASIYEDDCSPIEEGDKSQKVPAHEASPPPTEPELGDFSSDDLPLPQHLDRLCLSPPPMASSTVSIDAACRRSMSTASSKSGTSSEDENLHFEGERCNCLLVEVRELTEAAKNAVLRYYKKHARIYTYPDGTQAPLIHPWMREYISREMDLGRMVALGEMKKVSETARPGSWPMNKGEELFQCHSGRMQP